MDCPLYQQGLYIEKLNSTDAVVGMCCFQELSKQSYNTIDFFNNEYLTNLRTRSAGMITECNNCWKSEIIGHLSHRQGQILAFKSHNIENTDSTNLVSLTYNCENTCNLKCITCGPRYSSMWRPEYEKLNLKKFIPEKSKSYSLRNRCYENLDFSKLTFLHFQGGEPLLTVDHENILEQVAEHGNIHNLIVSYNTNGTIFPSQKTIDLWKQCKLVKIYFSIDAIGKQFEYIRFPGKWDNVESVMFRIRDIGLTNIWIELGVTVGINNVFYLQDIIDWRDRYFLTSNTKDLINIYANFTGAISYGGKVLALNNISSKLKPHAIEYLNKLSDQNISKSIITLINNVKTNDSNEWINYLNSLDNLRKTDWTNSLESLYNLTK